MYDGHTMRPLDGLSWRMGWRLPLIALLLSVCAFGPCGEANPQPSPQVHDPQVTGEVNPEPGPDRDIGTLVSDLTYASTLPPEQPNGSILVVGAPGAVVADATMALRVYVEELDAEHKEDKVVDIATDGGFAALLDCAVDQHVVITLVNEQSGPEPLAELRLAIRMASSDPELNGQWAWDGDNDNSMPPPPSYEGSQGSGDPSPAVGDINLTSPDENGKVIVYGGYLSVTPNSIVVIFHEQDGQRQIVLASDQGEFKATLAALSGDSLDVFSVAADNNRQTSALIRLTVP